MEKDWGLGVDYYLGPVVVDRRRRAPSLLVFRSVCFTVLPYRGGRRLFLMFSGGQKVGVITGVIEDVKHVKLASKYRTSSVVLFLPPKKDFHIRS